MYFEIHKNINYKQPYWWVIKSDGNHHTLATSEMYSSKQAAIHGLNVVASEAKGKPVYDKTGEV